MITTQGAAGIGAVSLLFGGLLKGLGALITPEAGIVVHSLEFVEMPAPAIAQHRTVTATNALTARYEAEILVNGEDFPGCSGSGSWNYTSGEKRPVIPVDDWVSAKGCWDALPIGEILQGCARYNWGDGQSASQCTLTFRKTE